MKHKVTQICKSLMWMRDFLSQGCPEGPRGTSPHMGQTALHTSQHRICVEYSGQCASEAVVREPSQTYMEWRNLKICMWVCSWFMYTTVVCVNYSIHMCTVRGRQDGRNFIFRQYETTLLKIFWEPIHNKNSQKNRNRKERGASSTWQRTYTHKKRSIANIIFNDKKTECFSRKIWNKGRMCTLTTFIQYSAVSSSQSNRRARK